MENTIIQFLRQLKFQNETELMDQLKDTWDLV